VIFVQRAKPLQMRRLQSQELSRAILSHARTALGYILSIISSVAADWIQSCADRAAAGAERFAGLQVPALICSEKTRAPLKTPPVGAQRTGQVRAKATHG
jgi:hypothetical protein